MIKELERVALTRDLPHLGLKAGDVGTVVLEHHGKGYEVEFVSLEGETMAVVSLTVDDVRRIRPREIANARPMG